MKFLGLDIRRARPEERGLVVEQGNGVSWLSKIFEYFQGPMTSSGIRISPENSTRIGAVFTAVSIITRTIASLPLVVYRKTDAGSDEATRHWSYTLLSASPNAYHTTYTWLELMVAHRLLWGSAYNRIEWLMNGQASDLLPLMPWTVTPKLTSGGVKYYQVQLPDGKEELPDDEVLHMPAITVDGLNGMSVIERQRDALGLAKSAEDLAGSFFANGAKPGWNLVVPGRMSEPAQKNLAQSIADRFAKKEALGVLVTEEGSKLVGPLMMPLKDAQFVEMRRDSRSEIFGWFGVPPHLAGDTEKSTSWGTGIEQMDIGYAKHTIRPICVAIEQEINRKLYRPGSGFYCKFDLDELQRGDFLTRMEGFSLACGRPFIAGNEARSKMGFNRSTQPDMDQVAPPSGSGTPIGGAKAKQGDSTQ